MRPIVRLREREARRDARVAKRVRFEVRQADHLERMRQIKLDSEQRVALDRSLVLAVASERRAQWWRFAR